MGRVTRSNRSLLIQHPTTTIKTTLQLIILSTLVVISCCQSQEVDVIMPHSVYKFTHFTKSNMHYKGQKQGIRQMEECAAECEIRRFNGVYCDGYRHLHSKEECWFYRGTRHLNGVPNISAYVFQMDRDVFYKILHNGRQFSLSLSSLKKTYADASDDCKRVGAYLLQMESAEMNHIVHRLVYKIGFVVWVGVTDIVQEDRWLSDKDGSAIDMSTWPWKEGEPHVGPNNFDCAVVHMHVGLVLNNGCLAPLYYVCERDY